MGLSTEWAVIKSNVFISNQRTSCGNGAADLSLNGAGRGYVKLNTSVNAYVNSNADGGSMFVATASAISTFYANSIYNSYSVCCGGSGISAYTCGVNGPIIKNNYFKGSYAGANGGVISMLNGTSNSIIQYNTFENTSANQGGQYISFQIATI